MTSIEQTRGNRRRRKPTIAILGEFSSGKSTLVNALLGHVLSPVRVTATQVPPIWYCAGEDDPVVVSKSGDATVIDPSQIAQVPVAGTEYVRVYLPAEILARANIIDMPGSSDPSMSVDIWNHLLPQADAVIWCTPATQAWRQSEAAIWEEVDPDVQERSLLLVSRIDKVLYPRDRERLLKRVARETDGMFRKVLPVDLVSAQDDALRDGSGFNEVEAAVNDLITEIAGWVVPGPEGRGMGEAKVVKMEARSPGRDGQAAPVVPRRITGSGRPGHRARQSESQSAG